jgi:hypothetical protein
METIFPDNPEHPEWTPDLPGGDFPYGHPYRVSNPAGEEQTWIRTHIFGGQTLGRWAYGSPDLGALADRLFNNHAPHFIGMLEKPFTAPGPYWILIHPQAAPPPETIFVEPEKTKVRYERSKEVFDVNNPHDSES